MCSLIKCDAKKCSNLTVDTYSEYGCYCFIHSAMTHKPRTLDLKEDSFNIMSSHVLMTNTKNEFISISSKNKSIKSMIRKAPLPKINTKNSSIESTNNLICCKCDDVFNINARMKCGHFICSDCLDMVIKIECPVCDSVMEGPMVTEELINEIDKRNLEFKKYGY